MSIRAELAGADLGSNNTSEFTLIIYCFSRAYRTWEMETLVYNAPFSGACPLERQISLVIPSTLLISNSLSFSFFLPSRITAKS